MIETHLPKADGDGVYTKYLTSPAREEKVAHGDIETEHPG